MKIDEVLAGLYSILTEHKPEGINTVFDPGQPFFTARQYRPAIYILPAAERAFELEFPSADIEDAGYNVEIDILTEDFLTRGETRERGDVSAITGYVRDVWDVLKAHKDLDGLVFGMAEAAGGITPGAAVIFLSYYDRS